MNDYKKVWEYFNWIVINKTRNIAYPLVIEYEKSKLWVHALRALEKCISKLSDFNLKVIKDEESLNSNISYTSWIFKNIL